MLRVKNICFKQRKIIAELDRYGRDTRTAENFLTLSKKRKSL